MVIQSDDDLNQEIDQGYILQGILLNVVAVREINIVQLSVNMTKSYT